MQILYFAITKRDFTYKDDSLLFRPIYLYIYTRKRKTEHKRKRKTEPLSLDFGSAKTIYIYSQTENGIQIKSGFHDLAFPRQLLYRLIIVLSGKLLFLIDEVITISFRLHKAGTHSMKIFLIKSSTRGPFTNIPPDLLRKTHLTRQCYCWSLRCSWSIAFRRCSKDIFILDLTPVLNGQLQDETRNINILGFGRFTKIRTWIGNYIQLYVY